MEPEYLGDGVYATCANGQVELRLGDHRAPPIVYLESEVLAALAGYAARAVKEGALRR